MEGAIDWCALPVELLRFIAEQLDFLPDLVSFSCTCASWRSVVEDNRRSALRGGTPLLMLREEHNAALRRTFFSISNRRRFKVRLPELRSKRCVGVSHGWMAVMEETDGLDQVVQLLNPFSKGSFRLPPLTVQRGARHGCLIERVVFSDPDGGSELTVMAISIAHKTMGFWAVGDAGWTAPPQEIADLRISDAIHCGGRFIAVQKDGRALALEFSIDHGRIEIADLAIPHETTGVSHNHLVESSDALLLVARWYDRDNWILVVFRLDTKNGRWIDVREIGNRTIFLGNGGSSSIAPSSPGGLNANSIFFIDDFLVSHYGLRFHMLGVFDLNNRTARRIPCNQEQRWEEPLFWIEPRYVNKI